MKQTLYEYCIQHAKTSLLEEWDMERNAPAAPWTVTSGSSKKVWWKWDTAGWQIHTQEQNWAPDVQCAAGTDCWQE